MNPEFNVVVKTEDFRESDIKLFFGEENPPNLVFVPADFTMWDLLADLGLFPSRSQARKDPKWKDVLEIPPGWSEFTFGKKRIKVHILNIK